MLHELKIHDQPLDFSISDFRLSDGIDGIEAVRMAREQCGREVAACLISGDVDPLVRQQTQAAGLVLLQKPVHPAKIGNLLRRSRQAGAKDAPEQP
jgi:CheY-like chemotaxis protein